MTVQRKRSHWGEGEALVGEMAWDVWLPGYAVCDFIDPRISVAAQQALYALYKQGGERSKKALLMLAAVKRTQLAGVYKQDEAAPAQLAARNRERWWTMLEAADARVFTWESPPMMVFAKGLGGKAQQERLADALLAAWDTSQIHIEPATVPPPSGRGCGQSPPLTGCCLSGREDTVLEILGEYKPDARRGDKVTLWMDSSASIFTLSEKCWLFVDASFSIDPAIKVARISADASVQIVIDGVTRITSPLKPCGGPPPRPDMREFCEGFFIPEVKECHHIQSLEVIVTGTYTIHDSAGSSRFPGRTTLRLLA